MLAAVYLPPDSFYAQFRISSGAVPWLQDNTDSPPERLLQSVWQHQRLLRDRLKTIDGRPIRVLHPGFLSVEGGPDFQRAMVQFGDEPAITGDIEVDLRSSGWRAHGHDRNPAFAKVILHVVWDAEAGRANGTPPAMSMRNVLDAPIGELSLWLGGESASGWPEELRGKCCAPLRGLEPAQLSELLRQSAEIRLRSKAAQFQARAKQTGWRQSLWEGVFRALGYKHNVWPMQWLGELKPRWLERKADALTLQARLLGISGLIPGELSDAVDGGDIYVRGVWDEWWRERDEFADCLLPKSAWRLHGLRPANHPQRRLALASHWAQRQDLSDALEKWCRRSIEDMPASLFELMRVDKDDFWNWHWTVRSKRLAAPQPLLGGARVTDLAVNVVLPWLWARAAEGKTEQVRQEIENRYFAWPAAEDNSLLRHARERLLGGAPPRVTGGAVGQQGLIQLLRDFCDHSNAICEHCKLPELVKNFVG